MRRDARAPRPGGVGPRLADEIVQAYRDARELDVFGVPSLRLGDAPPIYGPIFPEAPRGGRGAGVVGAHLWLIGRDDVYELKRWPRGAARPTLYLLLARPL